MELPAKAQNSSRIPELDGIRGLAIALVVFQHYVHDSIIPGTSRLGDFIKNNFTLGGTGVDLFFVLSGFLIGGILMDHRKSENYFKSFYIRRVCRILPLYYSVLIAYVFISRVLSSHGAQEWYQWLFVSGVSLWTYATFTQTIFQTVLYGTGHSRADALGAAARTGNYFLRSLSSALPHRWLVARLGFGEGDFSNNVFRRHDNVAGVDFDAGFGKRFVAIF
jgi:uncharacterized membrane protein YcfT